MKKINTHGIKMLRLREVSRETVNNGYGYSQISYDRDTGELLEVWHAGNPLTSWTEYHDSAIITVANTSRHMSAQAIADAVRDALAIL